MPLRDLFFLTWAGLASGLRAVGNHSHQSPLLFEETYEDGKMRIGFAGKSPVVMRSPGEARSGEYCLKSQLNSQLDPYGEVVYRTETSLKEEPGLRTEADKEYWIGMSIKFGDDFNISDKHVLDDAVALQWHYDVWRDLSTPPKEPFMMRWRRSVNGVCISTETGMENEDDCITVVPAYLGKWVDWVFHIKLAEKNGFFEVWQNHTKVVDFVGHTHMTAWGNSAYLKWGCYSSQYLKKEGVSLAGEDTRTIYHDEVRIAGADGSYDLVAPRS